MRPLHITSSFSRQLFRAQSTHPFLKFAHVHPPKGPALPFDAFVSLHGLFGSSHNWEAIHKRLSTATGIPSYALDLRNHGRTLAEHGPVPFDAWPLFVSDLQDFFGRMRLQRVFMIGHSFGGLVAMQYLMSRLERGTSIYRLLIEDIAPRMSTPWNGSHLDRVCGALLDAEARCLTERRDVLNVLRQVEDDESVVQFLASRVYSLDTGQHGAPKLVVPVQTIRQGLERLSAARFTADWEPTSVRTVFIRGGLSRHIADSDLPVIREYFCNSTVRTVPAVGHWVHHAAPDEFVQTVMEMLG